MATGSNPIDFVGEDLATLLAKAVSDGTYADIINTLKVDAAGQLQDASGIPTHVGQLHGNFVDDFFQKSYSPLREVSLSLAIEHGVIADGATDDTVAMQAWADAGGGQLPAGTIRLTSSVTYSNGTVIRGKGASQTIIDFQGTGYAFESATPSSQTNGLRISDLRIEYLVAADGGIHLERMSDALISNIEIHADTALDGNGIMGSGAALTVQRNVLRQVKITDALNGVNLDAGVDGFLVYDCDIDNCVTGCRATNALGMRVAASRIINGTNAVTVQATSSGLADGCMVMHNHFAGNTTNVNVAGTAANVRGLVVASNFHADGVHYVGVLTTTRPSVIGDSSPTADSASLLSGDLTVVADLTLTDDQQVNYGAGHTKVPATLEMSRSLDVASGGANAKVNVGALIYQHDTVASVTADLVIVKAVGSFHISNGTNATTVKSNFVFSQALSVAAGGATIDSTIDLIGAEVASLSFATDTSGSLRNLFLKVDEGATTPRTVRVSAKITVTAAKSESS